MLTKTKLLAAITTMIIAISLMASFFGNITNSPLPIYVVCVGDSITEGSGYPNELNKIIGANYYVSNFGVGGATVSLESSKPYMDQTAFQRAKARLPDIVVIMLGTNDAIMATYQQTDSFVGDYKKLVDEFQSLPKKPEIWLVKPPPIFSDSIYPIDTNLEHDILPRIEQVADELELPLIDVYSALVGHPQIFPDGVHPNIEGAKIIANEVNNAITSNDP